MAPGCSTASRGRYGWTARPGRPPRSRGSCGPPHAASSTSRSIPPSCTVRPGSTRGSGPSTLPRPCSRPTPTWTRPSAVSPRHAGRSDWPAAAAGSSGHQCATETLESADVCLAFGISRRGASAFDLPGDFDLIQVDHDLGRLANAPRADLALNGAAREPAQALPERLGAAVTPDPARAEAVRERHRRFLATRRRTSRIPAPAARPIRPSSLALAMAATLPRSLVTVDVGLTTLWVYRYMTGRHEFVWTSSFATMGFAVPAAAGLAPMAGDRPVVAAVGDGGIAVTLSELGTLRDLDLPVVVVVFDNGKLGAGGGGRGGGGGPGGG